MPTRAKMRQLKQEADTQESIRALIDKVTIDFERMPASDESISRRRRTTREGMLRGSAKIDQNDSTNGEGSCEPVAPSTAVSLEAPPPTMLGLHRPDESVDLESARVDIQIGDQAVGREEEELARRAAALQEDMDRLKQRKLKLHLAKYEHDLRLQAKERLAALETRSYQQMETKIKALADHTKRQLSALDEFDRDLRKKIQRLLSVSGSWFMFVVVGLASADLCCA